MAAPIKDHFLDLERHRRQLEENVAKLQTALQHWRMSDAEYEQLKEEVEAIPAPASRDDLEKVRKEFDGEVVTDKEVGELFGTANERPIAQIINLVSRRIDYVSKNVETLEKQLEAAEHKLAAASVLINPDVRDEEGLPFTDIVEQLDADDNVTSFHLSRPGDMQPQIREALAKAGIKDIPEGGEEAEAEAGEAARTEQVPLQDGDISITDAPMDIAANEQISGPPSQQIQEPRAKQGTEKELQPLKKGVSFAEDTKPGHNPAMDGDQPKSQIAQRLEEIMEQARQQAIASSSPLIPEDESAEDAELRKEMLRYGMTDIAPIVAELDIDENSGSEFGEAYSDDYDYDDDEDEDEHGRYKYRVIDSEYKARMLELEKKLGFKSTRELLEDEDEAAENTRTVPEEGIARIAIQPTTQPKSAMKTDDKPTEARPAKKGVKFASALDVAPDSAAPPSSATIETEQPFVDPMKSTIVERSAAAVPASPAATEPKKVSRFKKAKAAHTADALPVRPAAPTVPQGPADAPVRFLNQESDVRTAPTGPEGTTIAGTIVERDAPSEANGPDEFDAALLHQEAAVEYHRMRNRMILKEGGFMKDKEAPIEYPEEVDENGKRLSRFKAARLARQ